MSHPRDRGKPAKLGAHLIETTASEMVARVANDPLKRVIRGIGKCVDSPISMAVLDL